MTEREKFNALHRHEWELQGSAGVWESYYKCGKCGKQAREDSDGPAISADGCTQARAQSPQIPEGMALVPVKVITSICRDFEYSRDTKKHTPFLKINFACDDYDSRDAIHAILSAAKETQCPN